MNASIITAIVGAVAGIVGAVGVVMAWPGQRQKEKVDIAEAWEQHAAKLFGQLDQLRDSLAAAQRELADEVRQRRELEQRLDDTEGRLGRALRRIGYLEDRLRASGQEFNGPAV